MNEKTKLYFDQIAETYIHTETKLIDNLLDSLNLNGLNKVMDLACGKGIISEKLQKITNNNVIALDISTNMIDVAESKINNDKITFINEDFYNFIDGNYDAIICFDAYPHFLDVDNFVNKSFELLKDQGRLIILHDCGIKELNSHHEAFAKHVSRFIKSYKDELKYFENKFKVLEFEETENYIKIIFQK